MPAGHRPDGTTFGRPSNTGQRPNAGAGLIRQARLTRGLQQKQVAALAFVSTSTASLAERQKFPTLENLQRYGQALGFELVIFYRDPVTGEEIR